MKIRKERSIPSQSHRRKDRWTILRDSSWGLSVMAMLQIQPSKGKKKKKRDSGLDEGGRLGKLFLCVKMIIPQNTQNFA